MILCCGAYRTHLHGVQGDVGGPRPGPDARLGNAPGRAHGRLAGQDGVLGDLQGVDQGLRCGDGSLGARQVDKCSQRKADGAAGAFNETEYRALAGCVVLLSLRVSRAWS